MRDAVFILSIDTLLYKYKQLAASRSHLLEVGVEFFQQLIVRG